MMHYTELRKINVNDYIERKNGLAYLSWSWAVDQLLQLDESASWEYAEPKVFGYDPHGFHNDTTYLFYYWWDKKSIGDDSNAFESELLNWFNEKYNKNAKKVAALYVGEINQKERGTY